MTGDPTQPNQEENEQPSLNAEELALQSANTAREYADKAITAAGEASNSAAQAISSNQTANDNANKTFESVTQANANAEQVRVSAENAKADAVAAKAAANAASTSSERADEKNQEASASAESASAHQQSASQYAAATKEKLDEAEASATAAKNHQGIAATNATSAGEFAKKAEEEARRATDHADEASSNASSSKEKSIAATASAGSAAKDAIKAREESSRAKAEADEAARAHNLSTTTGLAGAFNLQAHKATQRLIIWGFVLAVSLLFVFFIGYSRFDKTVTLLDKLVDNNQLLATIGTQILLFLIGVAAPIWLAWVSTKMMNKYFNLSEDYSYKAALAKAYVGFRDEGKGLDKIFQERLFAAAITQLDANPLRFFDGDKHPGSPLQDLLQQPFMQAAMRDNKDFKDGVTSWIKRFFKTSFYIPAAVFKVANDMAANKPDEDRAA